MVWMASLVDYGQREAIPMRFLAQELLELVDDVLDELGSRKEVEYINNILDHGTSSDRQLAVYQQCKAAGANESEALKAVVDHLRQETMQGVD